MYRLIFSIMALLVLTSAQTTDKRREQFRVWYEWKFLDFEWETAEDREIAIKDKSYIPENVIISGINTYLGNIFLTMPRMLDGVPATLGIVPATGSNTAPKIKPFPSWEANKLGDCSALQFVQNIEIDKNGILWILDNGRVGTMTPKPDAKCPPSIVLIDLKSGHTMERIPLSSDITNSGSTYLNDLVVDNRFGDYAYITDNDATDPGIIVFRRRDRKSWKVRHAASMTADNSASRFRMNGTSLMLPVNIDGIAMGPVFKVEENVYDRTVYYCPLASLSLYAVNASVLMQESFTKSGSSIGPYVKTVGNKSSQTDGMEMDHMGVLFYGLIQNYTIAEWNSSTDFKDGQVTIARDPEYIQWVDRMAFDDKMNLFVVINRLQNFVSGKVNINEVNYRLLKSRVGSKSYIYGDIPDDAVMLSSSSVMSSSLLLMVVSYLLL